MVSSGTTTDLGRLAPRPWTSFGTIAVMAYDLAFWNDPRADRPEPKQVYLDLLEGRTVVGLGHFHTEAALAAVVERFPGLDPLPATSSGSSSWAAPDNSVSFEFLWSLQHLIATARGRYTDDQLDAIIDLGIDIGGGRVYDPQTDERFDGQ